MPNMLRITWSGIALTIGGFLQAVLRENGPQIEQGHPVAVVAPALCNAVFAAAGKRIRSLPLKLRNASALPMAAAILRSSDMNRTRIVTAAALLSASIGQALAAGPADAPPGALSCGGCHPTARFVDTTVPRLVNRNPGDIVAAMQGFKSGP